MKNWQKQFTPDWGQHNNTHQGLNSFLFIFPWRTMIRGKCLSNTTSAQNSTTVTNIGYNKVPFPNQCCHTARATSHILLQEIGVRVQVTLLNSFVNFIFTPCHHFIYYVLIQVFCCKLSSFCTSMAIKYTKESLQRWSNIILDSNPLPYLYNYILSQKPSHIFSLSYACLYQNKNLSKCIQLKTPFISLEFIAV